MQGISEEEEEVFFDSHSCIESPSCASPDSTVNREQELEFRKLDSEFWRKDLKSVRERRNRFLHGMGFDEFVSSSEAKVDTGDQPAENEFMERVTESSGAALDTLSTPDDDENQRDQLCCIKDLDSGKKFVIHDLGQDGLFSMLRELGSNKLISLQEFEGLLGLSHSIQKFMRKEVAPSVGKHDIVTDGRKIRSRSWWKKFMAKRPFAGTCKNDASIKHSVPSTMRAKVLRHKKRCLEFTALYMGQEIQAHKGLIRTMKFNPSGHYIGSGGEDCIVRIWQVREAEASCKCTTADGFSEFVDKVKDKKFVLGRKGIDSAPIVIPRKVFKIDETPRQELHGHTSDILDLSWSNSDHLLTSSMDKTVRMWKVGCDGCLKIFQHKDYVTCVQFNPVDDNYFISGSLDGKVRIWGVSETHVVDWADVRDIVTAICYRPDGEGFVVGSLAGSCRIYNYSGNVMQMDARFYVQRKKKSCGKLITGLRFSPEDSQKVMVTSADSKVRIFDGTEVIRKFRGCRRTKIQSSASFTADGRYIVSVGEDSNVYIWNYDASPSSKCLKSMKSIRSCEHFFSEDVSVAVPWTGMDQRQSSLNNKALHIPSQPLKILDPSTWLWDSDFRSFGAWLFADGILRGSATWPEEKLPISSPCSSRGGDLRHQHGNFKYHMHPNYQHLTCLSASWCMVIVTASRSGSIRTFHNYGLPVRL
ncbi:WD repeat-containing protein YMR102C-like [Iris pallida]|uniref:WD repeat-containing protein YMR102C-like n=1 Tax=Iris pallida TaxID=29817 RepID=A0AAX6EJH3_IRIPA|nr:WD repeat-containing protein YMR102C-like [Iris pallida]